MNINEVIELGKQIIKPDLPWYSEFTLGVWLWVIGLLVIGIALFVWGVADDGYIRPPLGILAVIASMLVFFIAIGASVVKQEEIYDQSIKEWETKYVKPYIESLPKQKKEIIYIKIDPELSHDVEGISLWGNGYTRSTAVERTPLTISYKGNGIITKTNWYETHMELTDKEKPYIEYQYLTKNVGHGIKKGIYNSKIYLPESYTFTDIK